MTNDGPLKVRQSFDGFLRSHFYYKIGEKVPFLAFLPHFHEALFMYIYMYYMIYMYRCS